MLSLISGLQAKARARHSRKRAVEKHTTCILVMLDVHHDEVWYRRARDARIILAVDHRELRYKPGPSLPCRVKFTPFGEERDG